MKNTLFSFIFMIMGTLVTGQTAQMVKDAQSIQKLLTDLAQSWNMHDAKAFSMVFSEDADFMDVVGMSAHGRAEIAKFHDKPFATWYRNSTLKVTDKKINFITAGIAAVDAWWEMTGARDPDGKEIPIKKGLFNFIMTKGDNKWFITVMHNMDLPVVPK